MKYNKDIEEGNQLSRFLNTMQQFNSNEPLEKTMKNQLEEYFYYRWANDKNSAITDQQDLEIFNQMPMEVKMKLLRDFMHKRFLNQYQDLFSYENLGSGLRCCYFGWDDDIYINFMFELL